jgi:hypothetical protein
MRIARGKPGSAMEYDHYVAIDWSLKTMAIAHMSRRDRFPRVFERPADLEGLKTYLKSLRGRIINPSRNRDLPTGYTWNSSITRTAS